MPRTLLRLLSALALLSARPAFAAGVPLHDHVVVVIMENKSYDETRVQPYTASLMAGGATLSSSYAVTHPSQPNYFALWAGGTLGVTNDVCPAPGTPFVAENFGHLCESMGLTWRAYSENLPVAGATGCSYDGSTSTGMYTRKHDPWTSFSNLNHLNERPYGDLSVDLAAHTLPNLAFVVPNNCHNTHNNTVGCGLADGDAWLAANLPPILNALGPHGVLVLTWDEDDSSLNNHILTVFRGPQVKPGYVSTRTVTHYTLARTLAEALGMPSFGTAAGETPITDIWTPSTGAPRTSWGRIHTLYR